MQASSVVAARPQRQHRGDLLFRRPDGVFGYSAYEPSKYAVRALCETLRLELAPHGIFVADVYPGDVGTPMLAYEKPLHPRRRMSCRGPSNRCRRKLS